MSASLSLKPYFRGLSAGIPIALGYYAVSFAFGIAALNLGLSPLSATIVSLSNLSSAGQFAGVNLIALRGTLLEIGLTVLVINLRYSLMAIALAQKLEDCSWWQRLLIAQGITDEIFALAIREKQDISFRFFLGLSSLPLLGWTLGTASGAYLGAIIAPQISAALGIALYCMFIAIIIPPAKHNKLIAAVVVLAAVLSLALAYLPYLRQIPFGWRVIIVSLVVAAAAAAVEGTKRS